MKLKILTIIGITALCLSSFVAFAKAADYIDVPNDHWAYNSINKATSAGIITGMEDGSFGLGKNIKRCEFAAMLNRLMKWEKSDSAVASFTDVSPSEWYFSDVETLLLHGAAESGAYRPEEYITRDEMAVMLVKALGYDNIAGQISSSPFSDVYNNIGYISTAYDFGIINGKDGEHFDPDGLALREECAAMMIKLYDKYYSSLDWVHGFYAISSWGQKEIGADMDNISFGWSRLEYSDDKGVWLNTTSENNNDWRVPEGYADAVSYFKEKNSGVNLAVLMNTSQGFNSNAQTYANSCEAVLLNEQNRALAVREIITAANDYDGVTIDFEGMKGAALKDGLNAFLSELRAAYDKPVYIAVHPFMDGEYYDAYDYRTIGEICDKIILMAHDYAANSMDADLMEAGFTTTPVTPFYSVYQGLKAISDTETGVQDKDKIALAVSLSNTAAWIVQDGKVVNSQAIHPAMETVIKRLKQSDAVISYSDAYRNPYAEYTDDKGQRVILWYEDSRSVRDKIRLARMFGINGLSIWRIGAVPNDDASIYYNVWDAVCGER